MLLFGGINLLGVVEMCILNLETGSEVIFTHPFVSYAHRCIFLTFGLNKSCGQK